MILGLFIGMMVWVSLGAAAALALGRASAIGSGSGCRLARLSQR
jgi:hypothetical protein